MRAAGTPPAHIAGRGQDGGLQLHRGVVQSRPSPFWHPLSIPNRLRDADAQGNPNDLSDKPSTKPGQLQAAMRPRPSDDPVMNTRATSRTSSHRADLSACYPEWSPCAPRVFLHSVHDTPPQRCALMAAINFVRTPRIARTAAAPGAYPPPGPAATWDPATNCFA